MFFAWKMDTKRDKQSENKQAADNVQNKLQNDDNNSPMNSRPVNLPGIYRLCHQNNEVLLKRINSIHYKDISLVVKIDC